MSVPPPWPEQPGRLHAWTEARPPRHLHILPSLNLGGAERIVVELARTLAEGGAAVDVAVMRSAAFEHGLQAHGVAVHRLDALGWPERIAFAAGMARASGLPAFCHLTSLDELRRLWAHGVRTVPVVHNVRRGWKEDPRAWNGTDHVPFVVACGDQVAYDR